MHSGFQTGRHQLQPPAAGEDHSFFCRLAFGTGGMGERESEQMFGYAGKILRVDLTAGSVREIPLDEAEARKYLGGLGMNSKLLFDLAPPGVDPLGPDNVLVFGAGPFVGTFMPTASKTDVSAKSPITGLFGATSSGYRFGSELKYAGYDHLVIQGRAERPVYLSVRSDGVQIRDGAHLWGKDVWETVDLLEAEHRSPDLQVAAIGPGGENLIRYSSLKTANTTDGPARAWVR